MFQPGEEKTLTVTYNVRPSYQYTSENTLYIYKLLIHTNHWHSYQDMTIKVHTNNTHKYMLEETMTFDQMDDSTYQGEIDINTRQVSFGLYIDDHYKPYYNKGMLLAIIAYLIFKSLPYLFVTIIVVVIITVLIRRYIKKRKQKKNKVQLND